MFNISLRKVFANALIFALVCIATPTHAGGTAGCLEHYSADMVHVDMSPVIPQTLPGIPVTFEGTIVNKSTHPIVNGQVYVKIFKNKDYQEVRSGNEFSQMVDFFLAKDNVSIGADTELPIVFDWRTPKGISDGTYTAVFYFSTLGRFDDIHTAFDDSQTTRNSTSFKVTSDAVPTVFSSASLTINGVAISPSASVPTFEKFQAVNISVSVENPTDEQKIVEIEWITSDGVGLTKKSEIERSSSAIAIEPRTTEVLLFTPPLSHKSRTLVQAVLTDEGAKSVLHIPFLRNGYNDAYLLSSGSDSLSLKKGEKVTVFSCVSSAQASSVAGKSLIFTLTDSVGNIIHNYTYTNEVDGNMVEIADSFVPQNDFDTYTLTTRLQSNDVTLDEVSQKFDCNLIDQTQCSSNSVTSQPFLKNEENIIRLYVIGITILTFIILGVSSYIWKKRVQIKTQQQL